LQHIFRASGQKVAVQNYEYQSAGTVHSGQNVYSIVQAPRGDATEAIVLIAAWRTVGGELNLNGVALALTLARYFKSRLSSPRCLGRDSQADSAPQDGPSGRRISSF
jgi:glycosylphosphatidylinositol transamidase